MPTDGVKEVHCAHHVRRERLHWFAVGKPHERLCREVENEVRIRRGNRLRERLAVTDVADRVRGDAFRKPELVEERRLRRRFQRKPVDLRPERQQPLAKPRALETRVPSHKNAPPAITI